MIKTLCAAVLLLFSLATITTAHADAPLLTTFNDAIVWHSDKADASGSTESVTIDPATNLLLPSAKPSDWGFTPKDPAADTITVADGVVRTQVGKSDGVDYHYQVGQSKIALVEGKSYVLSFRAKADAARAISVNAQAVGGDWHAVGLGQAVPLTTDWQTSKITFVAKNVTGNTQLVFNIGQQNGVVWIGDLALAPAPDASAAPETATALKINVASKGGVYDVQALSKPIDIANGQAYLLTFKARADAPRMATLVVRINAPDWHAVSDFDPSITLGTSWHTYSLPFTASNVGAGNNVVALSLGDKTGTTWVADLTVTHTGAGVVQKSELPVVPPVPVVAIPANAYRILFVGNSITQHGFDASSVQDLGWDHLSGMAATEKSKDYVHLLTGKIQALMPSRPVATRIVSLVPGGQGTPQERIAPVKRDSAGFDPDLVIIQHGEHELQPRGAGLVAATYDALLDLFQTGAAQPKIVCVGNWSSELRPDGSDYDGWSATIEHTMQGICAKRNLPFVSVASIAADPSCHGYGTNPGVQWHPDDRGHAKYADLIFTAVRPLVTRSTAAQSQAHLSATLSKAQS